MNWVHERAEVHYLARGVFGVVGIAVITAGFLSSAFAPGALAEPGRMLLHGEAEQARDAYVSIADGVGADHTRAEALWRAAGVSATDLGRPLEAIGLLQQLVERHPGSTRAPEALAEMARLQRDRMEQGSKAAPLWVRAAELAPDHPEAGRWLMQAARTYRKLGRTNNAADTLRVASRYPAVAAEAQLALGRVLMSNDPWGAHSAYQDAHELAPDEAGRRLASLGIATALEHLEEYDEALAELSDVEPDEAVRRRQERLRGLAGL